MFNARFYQQLRIISCGMDYCIEFWHEMCKYCSLSGWITLSWWHRATAAWVRRRLRIILVSGQEMYQRWFAAKISPVIDSFNHRLGNAQAHVTADLLLVEQFRVTCRVLDFATFEIRRERIDMRIITDTIIYTGAQ